MTTVHIILQSIHTIATHKRKLLENSYSDNTYWLQQQCAAVANNVNNDKYSIQFDIQPLQQDYKRARKVAVVDSIPPYVAPAQPAEPTAAPAVAPVNDVPKPKKGKKAANSKSTTLEQPVQLPTAVELGSSDIAAVQPAAKKTRAKKDAAAPVAAPVESEKPVRSTRAAKKAAEAEPAAEVEPEPQAVEAEEPAAKKGKKAAAAKKGKKAAKDADSAPSSQTATLAEPITVDVAAPARVSAPRKSDAKTPIATYDDHMQVTDTPAASAEQTDAVQPVSTRSSRRVSSKPASKHATPVSKPVDTTPTSLSATLSASVDSDEEMTDSTIVANTAETVQTSTKSPLLTSMQTTYDNLNKHSSSSAASSGNNSLTKPLPSSVVGVSSAVSLASSMLHAHNTQQHNSSNLVRPSVPDVNLNAMPTVKVPILLHKPQQSITIPLSQLHNSANNAAAAAAPAPVVLQAQRTSVSSAELRSKRLSQQAADAAKAAETAAIKQKYEMSKQLHDATVAETQRMKSRSNSNSNNMAAAAAVDGDKSVSVDEIEMSVDDNSAQPAQPAAQPVKPVHTKQSSTELAQAAIKPLIKPAGTVLDVSQIRAQKELLAAQHKQKQQIAEQRRKQLEEENRKMQALKDAERIKREEDAAKNRAALLKQKTIDIKAATAAAAIKPVVQPVKPLVKPVTEMLPPVKPVLQPITNTTINAKPITAAAVQLSQPLVETPKKPLVVNGSAQPATSTSTAAPQQQTPNSLVKSAAKGAHFSFSPAAKALTTPAKQPVRAGDSENYEMSDHSGSDSDEEQQQNSRGKKIPAWARDPLLASELKAQIEVDPDTIFPQLPDTCDLSTIFKNFRQNERFRKRYSSGNWTGDTLTRMDEITYKKHMGFYSSQHPHATL